MAESNIWEKREDLENTKKILEKFKGRINVEVRKQEKLDIGKGLQEGRITRKIYSKNVILMEWWKVWGGVFEKVGEELAKIEVSFSGGEILKGR